MKRSLLLPIVMCSISAPLLMWDLHNQKAIMAAGMAWDTGAPLWPYRTPEILLISLNMPAYLVANPLLYRGFKIGPTEPSRYVLLFLLIGFCWWLIGRYVDKAYRRFNMARKNRPLALLLMVLATVLGCVGLGGVINAVHWWWNYSHQLWSSSNLFMLRALGPSLWLCALCWIAFRAGNVRYTGSE